MSQRRIVVSDSVPRFPRHVQFRFDETRGRWIVLAPERVLFPDEIAVAILQRCDGAATVREIASALAREFRAPVDTVRDDVIDMLQTLADKGVIAT